MGIPLVFLSFAAIGTLSATVLCSRALQPNATRLRSLAIGWVTDGTSDQLGYGPRSGPGSGRACRSS